MLTRLLDEHRRLDRGGRPCRTYREALERFWAEYMRTLKPASQKRYRVSFRQPDGRQCVGRSRICQIFFLDGLLPADGGMAPSPLGFLRPAISQIGDFLAGPY